MEDIISKSLKQAQDVLQAFVSNPDTVSRMRQAVDMLAAALENGNKILSCGNGGSLCDADLVFELPALFAVRDAAHFAEELTGRFRRDRQPLPAMAINDAAYMTCVGNDFSFDQIFARWVEAFGRPGDVLLAISTSGNSGNVVMAVEKAREAGMKVLALTREGTNKLSEMADVAICAPTAPYSDRIQEIHIKVIHILIEALEAAVIYKDGTGER